MNRLADRTAIVTGGAAGIGGVCAVRLAEEGAKVALFDRDEAEARALANDLTAKGHDVAFRAVDVTIEAALNAACIRTPMVENLWHATAPDLEAAKAAAGVAHPTGTMVEPDDIARAAVWLASDEAKFVTGAEIVIDGGYTAR